MIECKFLNKQYENGQEALHRISFKIKKREMVFLTGHSGAGKSTLLKLIAHIESPTSGQLIVNGFDVSNMQTNQIPYLRRNIGFVFQSPQLLKTRNIFDNIALPLHVIGFPKQDIPKRVQAVLHKVGLSKKAHCFPEMLSGGEQQRAGIARAVVHRPSIVLADEPTGNLDPALSQEIMGLFSEFNQFGVTVLIATHDLSLMTGTRHRILVLNKGKLSDAI